ncbi:LIM and SH3 domain protein F42H10.3, partial [Trichinella pseudospiralis]
LLSFRTASEMMAPSKCARPDCGKTVYPMEELKCLDQVWHKQCFRCTACGMVLTMKNYKGYEKQPYCEAHYPKTKASVVADTPEMRRLQENTKNQSLIKYHEEYERMMKGKKIQVADDPEIQRLLKNTQIQSNVIYHGDLDRKETMERIRPPLEETVTSNNNAGGTTNNNAAAAVPSTNANKGNQRPAVSSSKAASSPYTAKLQQSPTLIYSSERGGRADRANYGLSPSPVNTNPAPVQNVVKRRSGGTIANSGLVVRALYDYSANDSDETVDKGWMTGTVQRTGKWGMLPANYVERVN